MIRYDLDKHWDIKEYTYTPLWVKVVNSFRWTGLLFIAIALFCCLDINSIHINIRAAFALIMLLLIIVQPVFWVIGVPLYDELDYEALIPSNKLEFFMDEKEETMYVKYKGRTIEKHTIEEIDNALDKKESILQAIMEAEADGNKTDKLIRL